MSKRFCSTLGVFALFAVCALAQTRANQRSIEVDVHYTGSGTVDANHRIYVALWDLWI